MLGVISNGSKWLSQRPDTIDILLDALENYTLDPVFEEYGNFIIEKDGVTKFFGNFLKLSHVFNIETDDKEIVEILTNAIRKNQQRKEYIEAR